MSNTEATTPEGNAMLDDLDAAMASSEAKDKSAAPAPSAPQPEEAPAIGSATLAQLPKARRPIHQPCAKPVQRRCGSLRPRK
jgi:hypothetical protein